ILFLPSCPSQSQCPPYPEPPNSRDSSMPETYGPEENYASLQISSTVTPRWRPSLSSFLLHGSSKTSTHFRRVLPTSIEESTVKKEDTVQSKKQKTRTIFSRIQLYVLSDRSQRQKYLFPADARTF
uniref:Uncharacterized protein n=1 Tax=Neovison vison TaxID=452646 RepID=A0A8C7A5D8_NEOVI